MYRIRTTKTGSDSTAVQVISYVKRKLIIEKHIGSSKDEEGVFKLKIAAKQWIDENDKQMSLLPHVTPEEKSFGNVLFANDLIFDGFKYGLLREVFGSLFTRFEFDSLKKPLLNDLVLARIVSPGSKSHSLKFLEEFFGIKHNYRSLTRIFPQLYLLKDAVEALVVKIAKEEFKFDFSFVFYDLTTLYFESFDADDLRKTGFSKDNKANQPQIMIGLLVNSDGFPIYYDIFPGNKFEGHTLIPVILDLQKKYCIEKLAVVADAAMINQDNIKFLRASKLDYIVGARLGNLPLETIKYIDKTLERKDNCSIKINDEDCGFLICHFSEKRYRKDKFELEKQVAKAERLLLREDTEKFIKKIKFITKQQKTNAQKYILNKKLIDKNSMLLGIKGYCTSLGDNNEFIISQYKNLWKIEKAFRISKSDLQIRPVFHYKPENIKSHVMVCFMALAIAKYIEIKTAKSIKSVIDSLKSVVDALISTKKTGKKIILRKPIDKNTQKIINNLK